MKYYTHWDELLERFWITWKGELWELTWPQLRTAYEGVHDSEQMEDFIALVDKLGTRAKEIRVKGGKVSPGEIRNSLTGGMADGDTVYPILDHLEAGIDSRGEIDKMDRELEQAIQRTKTLGERAANYHAKLVALKEGK